MCRGELMAMVAQTVEVAGSEKNRRKAERMSQLVAFYDESPVDAKGKVEVVQSPISTAVDVRTPDGAVQPSIVYVPVPSETGTFLVPFGDYDDWSLRDRYNEAIRIMNTLGAATITCETFKEVAVRRRFRFKVRDQGAELSQQRIQNLSLIHI